MFYYLRPTDRSPLRSQHKEGEPELVIISECKTCWSSRHDLLTHYLRVAATVKTLFRTQFQLSGNLLNNRETNAVVKLIDVLGSEHFAATIICKADTDLLVAECRHSHPVLETQVIRVRWIADELLELLEECHLKSQEEQWKPDFRAEALIYEAYCRLSAGIRKFLKDLHGRLQQSGEFAFVVDAGIPYPSTLDIT